jgi:CHAD domain-containing protein
VTTVEALCRVERNEDRHTEQVAALAVRLFDATRRRFGLDGDDRRVLRAAARLHDIGYARDPRNHAAAGARLVKRTPLRELTCAERGVAAAMILVHTGDRAPLQTGALADWTRDPARALRLGAFLRLADALDHSHLQDVTIRSMRFGRGGYTVRYTPAVLRGLLFKVAAKADIWNSVLPAPVRAEEIDAASGRPRAALLDADDPVPEAARKILFLQYRSMTLNRAATLDAGNPEALHDVRVALRRFRAALGLFRKPLDGTSAAEVGRLIRDCNRELGLCRDADVWLHVLERIRAQSAESGAGAVGRLVDAQRTAVQTARAALEGLVTGEVFGVMQRAMAWLARIELSDLVRAGGHEPFGRFARRRMRRMAATLLRLDADVTRLDPEALHALRKRCRRYRYWAEFCAPVLGRDTERVARRLKRVTNALGNMHDMDVRLAAACGGQAVPRAVHADLRACRDANAQAFRKDWTALRGRKGIRALL